MSLGATRRVIFVGNWLAVKIPRLRVLRAAMCANRWEREVSNVWLPVFRWPHVCPVLLADPFGLFVVMPRCKQPVQPSEVEQVHTSQYPDVTSESKPEDRGYLEGRVVALDYGLPLRSMVENERARYQHMASLRGAA